MKKKISVFIMILCLVLCTASCGSKDETAKYQVYYLDMDETSILGVDYEITASEDNPSDVVDELITAMKMPAWRWILTRRIVSLSPLT